MPLLSQKLLKHALSFSLRNNRQASSNEVD